MYKIPNSPKSAPASPALPRSRTLEYVGVIIVLWLVMLGAFYGIIYAFKPFASNLSILENRVDDRPLAVTVVNPEREVQNPFTEVTVIANKQIQMQEPHNRINLQDLGKQGAKHYYIARVSNLGVGDTTVTLKLKDEVGGTFEKQLTITRRNVAFPAGFSEIKPWDNAQYTLDGDDYAAVVNKQNRLLEDYIPDDLLDLNKDLGLYTLNNATLRAEAARSLKVMLDDLRKATGKNVTIASGYRSYETQVTTYANWIRELGEQRANAVSAKPGHSEHQLGTTVDFVSDETNWQVKDAFGATVAGKWLAENSSKYGYVQPYKTDQSNDGGYAEESWHFRYTGKTEN